MRKDWFLVIGYVIFVYFLVGVNYLVGSPVEPPILRVVGYPVTLILMIFSIWATYHFGNFGRFVTEKDIEKWGKFSIFISFLFSIGIFVIFYLLIPSPLVDSRIGEGYPGLIDVDSITYLLGGILLLIICLIVGLIKNIKIYRVVVG